MVPSNGCSHVEGSADTETTPLNSPFSSQGITVSAEGGYAHQGSDVFAVQATQFTQVGQERKCRLRPYSWHCPQQVYLLSPYRTFAEGFIQVSIQICQLPLEPGDVSLDSLTHWLSIRAYLVLLGNEYAHYLIPEDYWGCKSLGFAIWKGTWRGANCFSEMSQNLSIQGISLSQLASGSSEIPHLSRVDNYNRQASDSESSGQRKFQSTRCFEEHQAGVEASEAADQFMNSLLGVGHLASLASGADSNIRLCLSDIDPDERELLIHYNLLEYLDPSLHDAGLASPDNCSSFI